MPHHSSNLFRSHLLSRRPFLQQLGQSFGSLALLDLLLRSSQGSHAATPPPEFNDGLHHPARAKRVIQLFMNGGASQMDTFDHKPELERRHGEKMDFGLKSAVTSTPGALMKSPFAFKQHGESGRWVSDVFPHLARVKLLRSWAALRIMSPDGLPIYQHSPRFEGASFVTCHSGITLAAAHAKALPDWIGKKNTAPSASGRAVR